MGAGQVSLVLSALKNSPACMSTVQHKQQEAFRVDPQGLILSQMHQISQPPWHARTSWSFCGLASGWGLLW